MKIWIVTLATFGLIGCSAESQRATAREAIIVYTKDYKTGLCFAWVNVGGNSQGFTNVPCNPEVERKITGADP